MSRLFIELYLDEDVDVLLATLLLAHGFEATTTLDADMLGVDDVDQLAFAAQNQWAMLTHNRIHFESLVESYHAAGQSHAGVIIAVRRPPHELTRRLLRLIDQVTADEMENQICYI